MNEDGEDLEFGIRDELDGDDMNRSLQNSTKNLLPINSLPPNQKGLMEDDFEDAKEALEKKTGDFMPLATSSSNNLKVQRPKGILNNPLTNTNPVELNKEDSRSMLATYADY